MSQKKEERPRCLRERPAETNLSLGVDPEQPNYFRNPGARLAKALHQNRRGEADISTSQDMQHATCMKSHSIRLVHYRPLNGVTDNGSTWIMVQFWACLFLQCLHFKSFPVNSSVTLLVQFSVFTRRNHGIAGASVSVLLQLT